jgi:flagellar motility protein MotE (MotC chaperone)
MNDLQQQLLQTQQQLQRYNELNPRVKQFASKPVLAPMEKSMQQEFKSLDPMKLQTDLSNLTKQLQDQKSQQDFAKKYDAGQQASIQSINDKQKADLMNKF